MESDVTYLLRVWMPDRPGALGVLTSRLGDINGDVVGLEIIERGAGLAIDELTVSLPADVSANRVVEIIGAEEGFKVEDLRPLEDTSYDPQLDMLAAAAQMLGVETQDELTQELAEHVSRAVRTSWTCVVGKDGYVLGSTGDRPNDHWLDSFISGSPSGLSDSENSSASIDTIWLPLPAASVTLVVGGDGVIRDRERQRLAALARIADAWFRRLKEKADATAWAMHPSRN